MAVSNNQPANETTFNNAFVSKTQDSTVVSNVELADTDPSQGSTVTQVQRELNSTASYTGKAVNAAQNVKPSWSTNNIGTSTDSLFARVNSIDGAVGAVNGLATLDGSGKVPSSQLPSYVDDVEEYANLAGFPVSGETGKIYVAIDTGKTYRWTGTIYVEISPSDVNSVFGRTGVVTAQSGDYTATQVTNTPAGDIVATTVQAAINELDTEKVPTTRTITAGAGLSGGGDLSADRTISMPNIGTASTYGSATQVPVFTTDAQGRVSAVTNTDIYSSNNDGATGANATLTSVSTTVVRLTNASLTSIDMIPAGFSAQQFILINRTGVAVTVNNNTGGTPANRIYTGTGANLSFADDTALFLEYDNTEQRWQVVGGSGAGGLSAIGTIDSVSKSADGAVISGPNLIMQTADATNPGLVSTGAQTIAGVKTLNSSPILNSLTATRPLKIDGSKQVISSQIDLANTNDVTGTLAVGNGGTGLNSAPTVGQMLRGNGTNYSLLSPGNNNQVLMADATDAAGIGYRNLPLIRNYVSNPNFESNTTTDWSLGTVGTLTNALPTGTPTFGSGAAGTLSRTIISSGQLSGLYSLRYEDTASTTQGNMLATAAMSIDLADRAKVLSVRFDYEVISGASTANFSGTSSNSLAVAVWDVTNSAWLQVTPAFGMIQSAGPGEFRGSFQTLSSTASVRLVIYNANATTGGLGVNFDNFYLGAQQIFNGNPLTDFNTGQTPTYTASTSGTFTPGAGTSQIIKYMRIGKFARIFFSFRQTAAGSNGVGNIRISLPTGLVADTSDCGVYTGTDATICRSFWLKGTLSGNTGGSNGMQGSAYMFDSTTFCLAYLIGASAYGIWGSASVGMANTTTNLQGWFDVPIQGWGSTAIMSSDSDNRPFFFYAHTTTNSASAATPHIYTTVVNDTHGGYNVTNGRYTIPISGFYQVSAAVFATTNAIFQVYRNATLYASFPAAAAGSNLQVQGGSVLIRCNAGDILDIRNNSTVSGTSSSTNSYFMVTKVAPANTIAATETIAASVFITATTSAIAANTAYPFTSKNFDTHNAYNTTTGNFTCPASGVYEVCASSIYSSGGVNTHWAIYRNGTKYGLIGSSTSALASPVTASGSVLVRCNAGDTLFLGQPNGSRSLFYQVDNQEPNLTFKRIGL